jgi:hypothetical protein
MGKRRLIITPEYRRLRELAESYGAEDVSPSDEAAQFGGFRNAKQKQEFAEKAMIMDGVEGVSYFQGDIAVWITKFSYSGGTTKRRAKE